MSTILSLGFQGAETTGNHSRGVLQIGLAWSQHSAPGVILKSFPQTGFLALFPWSSSQHWSFPKLGSSWRSREVKTSSFLHSPVCSLRSVEEPVVKWSFLSVHDGVSWGLSTEEKKQKKQNSPRLGLGTPAAFFVGCLMKAQEKLQRWGGGGREGPP